MALEDSGQSMSVEGAGREAALPVAFDGIAGLFQPEDAASTPREAAVLLLPPWGFEEMCTRKFYRILAEHLAARGMPSLRFDYPGTGDSAGGPADGWALADWEKAATAAADKLRDLSGRPRIVLLGQGVGATIVQMTAPRIEGVDAVVLLAPALNGRGYVRELALWSKVVDQGLGLREDQRDLQGVSIASLKMPATIAEEIRKVDISVPQAAAAPRYLVLERAARAADTRFADGLEALGVEVTSDAFEGYDELVVNPTFQTIPMTIVRRIVEWLEAGNPTSAIRSPGTGLPRAKIVGPGYRETAVRFGSNRHLYGVLCFPEKPRDSRSVLILATAYDRSAGWGRSGVETARALAAQGIASFRFDCANVGDSVPLPDTPVQVLYSDTQNLDAIAALDLMKAEFGGEIIVAGRCSGAYLAIRHAFVDQRVTGVVSVNPFVFYWDRDRDVDAELRFVPRSLEDYGQRLASLDTLKRLLTGGIDVPSAARNIMIALARRLGRSAAPLLRRLPGRHLHAEVKQTFDALAARQTPVSLIYSEGDVGLDDLRRHFGENGAGLGRYRNVRLTMLPDTDHNLTPERSRRTVFEEILKLATS